MSRSAVFIDKDGTLVTDIPYNVNPARLELMPGALKALARLQQAGYPLVLVSNQPGVAMGYFEEYELTDLTEHLVRWLGARGISLAGFYYCPHHPEALRLPYRARCECRKPAAGLLRRAARELDLDLSRSWMIGDILDDMEAGQRAGCRTILVDAGHETEWHLSPARLPSYVVSNLAQAGRLIAPVARIEEVERRLNEALSP